MLKVGKTFYLTQLGRSMIEMLGVLAVVGLLSIGGLVAYRRAMIRHLANNVIEDINLAGFVILDGLYKELPDNDEGLDLTGRFEQTSPYTYKGFAETKETFEILVQGVPYPVCQDIVERGIEDMAGIEEIRANGLAEECFSDSGENEMSFFFGEDENATPCNDDTDCGTCGICGPKHTCRGECEVEPVECTTNADCTDFCSGCIIEEGAESGTCQYACEPVEYIENQNPGSYLLLPIAMNKSIKYKIDLKIEDLPDDGWSIYKFILGSRHQSEDEAYLGFNISRESQTGDKKGYFLVVGKHVRDALGKNDSRYGPITNIMGKHSLEYTGSQFIADGAPGTMGGVSIDRTYNDINVTGVFGLANSDTGMSGGERRVRFKLYHLKIRNNSTRMDLVPVLDPNGVPAMMDKVNKQLYYNAGSGTFKTDKD